MFTARYVLHSTFCPHSVFMCFVWIWEQTAIISLYSIDWLVFITETECVYCAVWAHYLYTIQGYFILSSGVASATQQVSSSSLVCRWTHIPFPKHNVAVCDFYPIRQWTKSRREVFINVIKKVSLLSIRTIIVVIMFAIWYRLICGLLYLCQVTHIALLPPKMNTDWYSHINTGCHSSFLNLPRTTRSPFSVILFSQKSAKHGQRATTVWDNYSLSLLHCPRWANSEISKSKIDIIYSNPR